MNIEHKYKVTYQETVKRNGKLVTLRKVTLPATMKNMLAVKKRAGEICGKKFNTFYNIDRVHFTVKENDETKVEFSFRDPEKYKESK